MADSGITWPDYIYVVNGCLHIRDLSTSGFHVVFDISCAEELAATILAAADEARRESPEVKQLTEDLAEIDSVNHSWEDFAVELVRKGYRKT